MTGQANPRPKCSLAVWTGNGGSSTGPVGTVLSGLSVLLRCRDPVGLKGFCSFVDCCSLPVSVPSCPFPCSVDDAEGFQRSL